VAADVIALQEVMGHQAETPLRGDGDAVESASRRHLGYAYSSVVLSRLPIRSAHNYDLSVRGAGTTAATHGSGDERFQHAAACSTCTGDGFGRAPPQGNYGGLPADVDLQRPRIVLGDFNEWTKGLTTHLLRAHMKSAESKWRSYPGLLPLLHLDHIYYDDTLCLEKLPLHRTRKALMASDHLPLAGDFAVA
jgi:endonuclease/exonuclease/phosphatase family metal-dependent hydrolase